MFSDVPFFTVILPTFNRARLIERALRSVLEQTFTDWQLAIVDDGSRDETFSVVEHYVRADPRIQYHFAANQGLAGARNTGARMALGEYMTFLDSDDAYKPEHLSLRATRLAEDPSIDLLHGGVEVIGPDMVADKRDPSRLIPIADCVIGGTFVVRRSLIDRLGGFRNVYGDDRDFFDDLFSRRFGRSADNACCFG